MVTKQISIYFFVSISGFLFSRASNQFQMIEKTLEM